MQTISRPVRIFVQAVIATATLGVIIFADQISRDDWPQLLLIFGMMVVASSVRIPDPRGRSVTPTTVLCYLAIYLLNPPSALLVIGTGRTIGYSLSRGWVPWRALFNGSQMALSVAIAAAVYGLLGGVSGDINNSSKIALFVAPLVHHTANNFFVAFGISRWRGTPLLSTWFNGIHDLFWPNLLSIPTAVILAFIYAKIHQAGVLAYLVLLPLQRYALHLYIKRSQLYAQIVDGLVVATDVNFPLGRGHARRVADLSVAIAREMRLSEAEVEAIQFAALLHDVGMIGKDHLMEKPVLTAEDADGLKDHVRIGAEIAKELPRKDIAALILRHHERYNGTGYPGGLSGEAIPLGARIVVLAEVVDSMAAAIFPYVSSAPLDSIISHVTAERGRAFDPNVADAFLRTVEKGSIGLVHSFDLGQERESTPVLGELPAR